MLVNRVHHDLLGDAEPNGVETALASRLGPDLAAKVTANFLDYHLLARRDSANIARLEAEFGDGPLLLVPHFDDDVHDIDGLLRIHRYLFASHAERARMIEKVVASGCLDRHVGAGPARPRQQHRLPSLAWHLLAVAQQPQATGVQQLPDGLLGSSEQLARPALRLARGGDGDDLGQRDRRPGAGDDDRLLELVGRRLLGVAHIVEQRCGDVLGRS